MSDKRFTPGPWVAELNDTPYAELPETWTIDSDSGGICTVDCPEDDRAANALLIAAAPDLLAAAETALKLPGLVNAVKEVPLGTQLHKANDALADAIGSIRTAIAKATTPGAQS